MKTILYFEWLHFSRNIARPLAVLLFVIAAVFSLYNGMSSYNDRMHQISAMHDQTMEMHNQVDGWFTSGARGPEERPWVDITTPFWSMWYANHYLIEVPKPTMIYNTGQSEHFGYYKRVSMWTTAFDDDLTAEIANSELVQLGALDFSFVWLYLMPLLLIVLTYHTKGLEYDLGFIPLLRVQQPSLNSWLSQRLMITGFGILLLLSLLISLPALFFLGNLEAGEVFSLWLVYALYLVFWLILIFVIIRYGRGQADQALKMVGVWILITVAIPAVVNQYVLLKKPADLMMSMIEAGREGQQEVYDRPENQIMEQAFAFVPEIKKTSAAKYDTLRAQDMINATYRVVLNRYMSEITSEIIEDQESRNELIASTYWFNPVTGIHNWLNRMTSTGHQANLEFRKQIQKAGEEINKKLIIDEWNKRKMDKAAFKEYVEILESL